MNRTQAAQMPTHFSNYKGLVVGDVIPTDTMRMHSRLFAWSRRKHIAVKDDDASQLNAYLINPAYLSRSVVTPAQTQVDLVNSQRVIQYSQISRNIATSKASTILHTALMRTKKTASLTTTKIAAFAGAIITQARTVFHSANIYTLQHGARKTWSRRLATFATALALVGAGSAPFIMSDQDTIKTTGQNTTSSSIQSADTANQNSRSVPGPNNIPLFSDQSAQAAPQLFNEPTASHSDTSKAAVIEQVETSYSMPAPIETNPSTTETQTYPSTTSPDQSAPLPIAPEQTVEPLQTIQEVADPQPLLEGVTYNITETVSNTADTTTTLMDTVGL